jgi:single-strand DNA-binding protein
MRYTGSGTPVCNFTLATDEGFKDKSGEWQKRTEWHRIVAWARLAEQCSQLLNKGKLIYVEGRLQTREWDDREGNKRRTTEIVIQRMRLLTPKGEG